LKEDCEHIVRDEVWSEKVPEWMNLAAQVATGNRRRVLEDGPDKMNSDDEESEDMKPDEEPNMYAPGMDPRKGPLMLSQAQVASQKSAAQAQKELRVPPRSQSPIGGSSDDDDPDGSENVWSQSRGYLQKNKHWKGSKATSVPALPAPERQKALPAPERINGEERFSGKVSSSPTTGQRSDTEDQEEMTEDQKRCARIGKKKVAAPQKAPAVQKPVPEAKASQPVKGQESPGTKVSKPMETRRQATSRAGGLRPGGRSGQTDTRVASGNPSKT
jgi:hypothetical protein